MGVRPPKSSVPVDVVGPSSGPAPPTRVDDMGQQRLGRPTSVDVASSPGLPSAGVDAVRQSHSSFLGADVVRPAPIRADVAYPSSMGADAARPMTLGGTHPPSLGAGVVEPMPTHVVYPSSVPIVLMLRCVHLGLRWPMLGPIYLSLGQRMLVSMLPCVRVLELELRLNVACISNVYCQVVVIYSVYIHL